jgi:lactate dehydrogenase-like 2-hydroxyacid dehydrogenase
VLGIVGMGRIGQAMARRARGFGLEIHYHNRSRLPQELEEGATYHETLESLLPLSRFLSLHCPGGGETERLLDESAIGLLPEGAVVVNTARGSLVDDEALLAALRSGKLFAAGLDVFAGEPALHPGYRDQANCFLLPHVGSATVEARDAMGFRCLDNLDTFFRGERPPDALT